jgi:surface antigen
MNIKSTQQKTFAVILLFFVSLFIVPTNTHPAEAATLGEINGQIDQVSKNLEAKRGEATSLQNQVEIIDGQIFQLQLQMQATQLEIEQTTTRILEVEAELKKQKVILNEYLSVIYEDSNVSPMEQIAGSNSFSEFVDKSEYLQTMQLKIKTVVDEIKKLKSELDAKKVKLDEMQKSQTLQKQGMDQQRALKDSLLAKANADAQGLQGQLNDLYAQKAAMSVQFGEGLTSGSSGYPYGSPPPRRIIDTPDPWGYLIGECTSYAAWKRAAMGRPVPRAMGNAGDWARMANGGPTVGSVMVMPNVGYYGHVAIVEAVYGNGSILISEYNWIPYSFSTRVVNPYNYGAVYIN